MDAKEKLVEILKQAPFEGKVLDEWWWEEKIARIADHLIAHGVTVQEWISVKDRLPENICPVLVALDGISIAFNGWYHDGKWWTVGAGTRPFTQKVTHWMPLPQPPKGE